MERKKVRRKGKWRNICLLLMLWVLWAGCGAAVPVSSAEIRTVKPGAPGRERNHRLYECVEDASKRFLQIMEETARVRVRGIFVTGPVAGTERMEELISLVDETELNAIVMDIKNDEGRVVYDMQIPQVQELGAGIRYVRDMEGLVQKCRDKNIYLIARIVAFKDPYLAQVKPDWCVHNQDGSIFRDKDGLAWLNPYNREVWDYLLAIAREALGMGFQEVQFDYVRFSTDSAMEQADFGEQEAELSRQEIITEFIKYASQSIHEAGGKLSADVYGVVIDSEKDQQIVGQDYVEMSRYLDYISPMVYPSHYGPYNYGIPVPDAEPYLTVLTAMRQSRRALSGLPDEIPLVSPAAGDFGTGQEVSGTEESSRTYENVYAEEGLAGMEPMEGITARVRPWLQDFTATWVSGHIPYEGEQIRAQIQAVYDAGYEEWILWNASNRYTQEGLDRVKER